MPSLDAEFPRRRYALKCTALYALAGILWITLSDRLVDRFLPVETAQVVQTVKGWTFVGLSALVLFWAVRRFERRISAFERQAISVLEGQVREQGQALQTTAQVALQTSQDLEAMAQSVARDLRAPLRAITGFADIVRRRYAGATDAEAARYVEHIVAAADQMSALVDDLGAYTKLSVAAVRRQPLELEAIVNDAIESLGGRIRETGAVINLARPLPMVVGEKTLVRQIVVNLLDNALKFSHPGQPPMLDISARTAKDGTVMLAVRDNGIGIHPEYVAKLFRPFQRLHTQDEYPGAGLGLASVKRAASMMGGSVGVESEVGKGSEFRVTLPGLNQDRAV